MIASYSEASGAFGALAFFRLLKCGNREQKPGLRLTRFGHVLVVVATTPESMFTQFQPLTPRFRGPTHISQPAEPRTFIRTNVRRAEWHPLPMNPILYPSLSPNPLVTTTQRVLTRSERQDGPSKKRASKDAPAQRGC